MTALRFCPVCAEVLATVFGGERDRLGCPTGHWTHWDNPLPVLAALVEVEGQILLARNAAWTANTFALITGFMERGETPEQGVARELKEETNLDAQEVTLIGNYEFIRKNEVILAYHVKASGDIRLSAELVDFRLIRPEKLRPWRAGTGYAMADWMRGRGLAVEFIDWPTQITVTNNSVE
ncbi:MAG: NUDIX domain-containing protein [Herminiimonas sp.]|nr:NUDIX domain-containing protein [Herminiimonas sp.]